MEIIDCHANLGWDASNLRKNLIPTQQSYAKLLEKMDDNNISKAIVLPFPSPGAQFNPNAFWYGNVRESAIEVLKMRGISFQKKIVAMKIESGKGIVVYPEQEIFGGT